MGVWIGLWLGLGRLNAVNSFFYKVFVLLLLLYCRGYRKGPDLNTLK